MQTQRRAIAIGSALINDLAAKRRGDFARQLVAIPQLNGHAQSVTAFSTHSDLGGKDCPAEILVEVGGDA